MLELLVREPPTTAPVTLRVELPSAAEPVLSVNVVDVAAADPVAMGKVKGDVNVTTVPVGPPFTVRVSVPGRPMVVEPVSNVTVIEYDAVTPRSNV